MSDPLANLGAEELDELAASIRVDLNNRVSSGRIVASLVEVGWTEQEARAAVERVEAVWLAEIEEKYQARQEWLRQQRRAGAGWRVALGAMMIATGIAATVGSYMAAGRTGGVYVITWGLVAAGAARLLTSWHDWRGK